MRNFTRILTTFICLSISVLPAISQKITVKGNIKNAGNNEVVSAVSITIKGTSEGTFTDDKGNFSITTTRKLPFTLTVSSIGYEAQEIVIQNENQPVNIKIQSSSALGQEVVVSATRTPQRILESPVSIERLSNQAIRDAAAPNYYDYVRNLKGVDVVSSGMLFMTPTTRGFSGSGNAKLNQIVDGMDNQAPGLNFPVGNTVGLTELDVDNIELLPGASSALYGSGGMNGTLLINSKSPFKYQGVSAQIKQGINHIDSKQHSPAPYYDIALRWAKVFNNKFAFKLTGQYIKAQDWQAEDTRNYNRTTTTTIDETNRSNNPAYDGINVYGDETNFNMTTISGALALQSNQWKSIDSIARLATNKTISRTGYLEKDAVDYNTFNFKGNGGLFYKLNSNTEISWQTYFGMGTTVYTGSDRYSLRKFKIAQHKLEVKGSNWFARAWTTQENAGDAYNATVMMRLLNEIQKPTFKATNVPGSWATQYIATYASVYAQTYASAINSGSSPDAAKAVAENTAHNSARSLADQGRLEAGNARFNTIYDSLGKVPISKGGAQFLDRTDLYTIDGQYKFDKVKFADITIGALWKLYVLNSQGTLFADTAGRIKINEYGGFAQIQKSFFNNRLKLNLAGRYDKNENFAGRFTPRVSALVKLAEDNNIRLSYQEAYRFPTTQNQWINLPTASAIVLGGLPNLKTFYKMDVNPVYSVQNVQAYGAAFQTAYVQALTGGATQQQAFATAAASAKPVLKHYQFPEYKAESMNSFELGYKGLLAHKRLLVDAYVFFSTYQNFLGRVVVIQSKSQLPDPLSATGLIQLNPDANTNGSRQVYSISTNASEKVKVFGWGLSADYRFDHGWALGGNIAYNELKENNLPTGFLAYWATPKTRFNINFSNNQLWKHYGFNIIYRYQSSMHYESDFVIGDVPDFGYVDLQVSRRLPRIRSMIKIGASNVFNKYYQTGVGNPSIGGLYYISFGYNVF